MTVTQSNPNRNLKAITKPMPVLSKNVCIFCIHPSLLPASHSVLISFQRLKQICLDGLILHQHAHKDLQKSTNNNRKPKISSNRFAHFIYIYRYVIIIAILVNRAIIFLKLAEKHKNNPHKSFHRQQKQKLTMDNCLRHIKTGKD